MGRNKGDVRLLPKSETGFSNRQPTSDFSEVSPHWTIIGSWSAALPRSRTISPAYILLIGDLSEVIDALLKIQDDTL